jgi:nicotinamidase-related amidase/type 1 glutamine amidotransferase
MAKKIIIQAFMMFSFLLVCTSIVHAKPSGDIRKLKISIQHRVPSELDPGAYIIANEIQEWNPEETAIIICDMWNEHWCKGATKRVAEMAPLMNEVVSIAREKGVLIVHAPSDCMEYYKDHPARKLGRKYKSKKAESLIAGGLLDSEEGAEWPIDQSDGGCDCTPECEGGNPWTHQIDLINIYDKDAISESGAEIGGLFYKKGIKNVILMGVHTNMCVIGRPFGLRNMIRLGMNVVLMRDMTDTMYDSKEEPNVSHFTGNSLVNEYIETYVCPSIVSSVFTGKKQFRFQDDQRPVLAFITAEGEYRSNQRLPELAHDLLLARNVNCEFAIGKPVAKGEGRHNIENLQILNDADLALLFIRRRALEQEKMHLIMDYVACGKPVMGIRTASHAFDVKKNVPVEVGDKVDAKGEVSEFLAQWPEFDEEVLGGNYQGHYGHLKEGTVVTIVPGMESHPLLKGVSPEGFTSPNWLYRNRPLRSPNLQVLMLGTVPGQPAEPVLWINNREKGKVIYTSLGHWDDWEIESFRQVIMNSIDFLLNL